jgi:hypothetical protein
MEEERVRVTKRAAVVSSRQGSKSEVVDYFDDAT